MGVAFVSGPSGGVAPYTYAWTFGDGGTAATQNPSHTFTTAGTYTARVTVTDSQQVSVSASTGVITVRSTLVASAGAALTSGDAPLLVTLSGSATGGQAPYSYQWSFGDGGTSTTQNPSHTYVTSGSYNAVLTVSDAAGATARATAGISVAADPSVTVGASPIAGDSPLTVVFTGSVTAGTAPFTYAWDFGDGVTAGVQNPTHVYTATGVYTARVTITDASGHSATASVVTTVNGLPLASASANASVGDAPLPVRFTGSVAGGTSPYTYTWAFGDGASSSLQSPTHTYAAAGAYSAQLTVVDASGQTTTSTVLVTVNAPPVAGATVIPDSGNAPLAVSFTGTASSGTGPYRYSWSFGDGATSGSQSPAHTYTVAGTYSATLTITDSVGTTAVAVAGPISVRGPLSVQASAAPAAGDSPLAASLSGSATGGAPPYVFGWDFGDGTTGNGPAVNHTYTAAGTYTAVLTVTDGGNNAATARVVVVVSPALSVVSSGTPLTGTAPVAVDFSGTAAGGKAPYRYAWTFGDGLSSSVQNPSHTYTGPGTFTVGLTITDANGVDSSAAALTVTISPAPLVASAASTATLGDAPMATTLTGSETGGWGPYTYAWDLGDGTSATGSSIGHTYASAGTYAATVTVTDSKGVTSQATVHITVHDALGVTVSATPTSGLAPLQVGFSAAASGGLPPYSFAWSFADGATASGSAVTHTYEAGSFNPTLTIRDAAGGTWTGSAGTIHVAGPPEPPPASPAGPGVTTGPGAGQSPPAVEPTPSAEPSPSPSAQQPAPRQTPGSSGSSGGSDNNLGLIVVLLGSALTAGLGASLFLGWRRLRLR